MSISKKTSPDSDLVDGSNTKERGAAAFPVAGIGASAGGLIAIKAMLANLPEKTGIAYVIVQHLSPEHESILPELLERETSIPVHRVTNEMKLEADNLYVIPPDTYMNIVDGHLTLFPRKDKSGIFLPIDFFFKNLAYIYQNKAIGILLSGTGSDGTAGFKDIKAEGGITFAQDASASFNGMPRSAVDAGYVDFILPAPDIASELKDILNHPYTSVSTANLPSANESELRKILVILNNRKGIDFSLYKHTTINRRILRRMALNCKKSLEEYTEILRGSNKEVELLYQDLLINVTTFFRDPSVFTALEKNILPALLLNRKADDPLRIWITACASGEECYSFAIGIFEYMAENQLQIPVQFFATDLNAVAIEKARLGIYPAGNLENVSMDILKKYFTKIDGHFQIVKSIRDSCVFSTHNLLTDPPFSRMDLVSCQNVMIYFEPVAQKKILKALHYALKPKGFLIMGQSETIGSLTNLFAQSNKEEKVYTKKETGEAIDFDFSFPPKKVLSEASPPGVLNKELVNETDIEKVSTKLLLSQYVPPSVVINSDLQILRFHGQTSRYLHPAPGKASLNLLKMVRDDLVFELRSLINNAKKKGIAVQKNGIHLLNSYGTETLSLHVVPFRTSSPDPYFLVLFKETGNLQLHQNKAPDKSEEGKAAEDGYRLRLQHELDESKAEIKTIAEEFEATREELQSANEEVLSSNEELQSINEELETSKEELQSTNEELSTINEELFHRHTELKEAFEYREAIVETIREPLIVLNADLRVSSANRAFYKDFRQTQNQTEGFFIYEMNNGEWNIPGLKEKLIDIISKDKSFENFEVEHEFSQIGNRIVLFSALRMGFDTDKKYRILLVIEDITRRRKAEEKLLESLKLNTSILNSISNIFIAVDNKWNITFINSRGERFAGKKSKEAIGKNLWETLSNFMDTDFHKQLVSAMKTKTYTAFEYFDNNEEEWYQFRLYPSADTLSIYGNRVTEEKTVQNLLKQSKERYELFISKSTEGICRFDLKEPVSINLPLKKQVEKLYANAFVAECNNSFAKMYGYSTAAEMEGKTLKDILQRREEAMNLLNRFVQINYSLSEVETKISKGGNTFYFLQNLVGILEGSDIISIWETQRDITSKKIVEDALIRTRRQLNFSLAAGSVGTYIWTFKTNKIIWTKVQESLYGLKEFSFKGTFEDWLSFIHPEDVEETRKAIEESISNHQELSVEFRIVWPDKSLHWILTRASSTYDKDGNPEEMSGVNIDISERKFKEQRIRENEERFKALVQNSLDVITVFNKDGKITYQSDSIERVLGWTAEDQLGKDILKDSLVHAEDQETEKGLYEKCFSHPSQYFQKEMRMLHKDDNYRTMEVGCINLINNPSVNGIIKNYRDISERKAVEKQKEEFIGIASHELKTPVTSIKAYTQILRDTLLEKKDEASADLLSRMDHQIDRLSSLIRDLLDVTKISEGQLILKHEQYDLNQLILEVVEDLQMTTKKHTIITELQEVKPFFGDKERTAQIIVNLLSNAIKYSPTADKIFIRTFAAESEVTVCIQDFGIGISEDMQKKLFKRFFRVSDETASTFPGLGLGLFIATEIVRRQHGRIWVESTPNEGSTFCFTINYTS